MSLSDIGAEFGPSPEGALEMAIGSRTWNCSDSCSDFKFAWIRSNCRIVMPSSCATVLNSPSQAGSSSLPLGCAIRISVVLSEPLVDNRFPSLSFQATAACAEPVRLSNGKTNHCDNLCSILSKSSCAVSLPSSKSPAPSTWQNSELQNNRKLGIPCALPDTSKPADKASSHSIRFPCMSARRFPSLT